MCVMCWRSSTERQLTHVLHCIASTALQALVRSALSTCNSGAQAEALNVQDVLAGGNLVYSAPTSAGKSAVAEVLMLRRLILKKRPALLVLPFVSLCAEKVAHLERLLAPLNKCGLPDTLPVVSA